ncbi:MAG: DUF433 domain-containing protein [Verrucomicrobiales bacterium]|nr:DUF433 domain-containing protein [Verrucomicrobiales bacterium]
MDYRNIITIEPGKRGGRPCVRGLRITVGDVLGWISSGMTWQEIVADYPDLNETDIRACLAYAADREPLRQGPGTPALSAGQCSPEAPNRALQFASTRSVSTSTGSSSTPAANA